MRHDLFAEQIRPRDASDADKLTAGGRIELIQGDVELYPGLELLKAGGHTRGSQMVALEPAVEGGALRRYRLHVQRYSRSCSGGLVVQSG